MKINTRKKTIDNVKVEAFSLLNTKIIIYNKGKKINRNYPEIVYRNGKKIVEKGILLSKYRIGLTEKNWKIS